jgi:hypothetical protein
MTEKNHNGYQEDPWGDEQPDDHSRAEPYLSSGDGVHALGSDDGVRFAGDATGGSDAQAGDMGNKGNKTEKGGKPRSTAKLAAMIGGGAVLVTVVGATAFWFVTKPSASPSPYPVPAEKHQQGAVPLTSSAGQVALPLSKAPVTPIARPSTPPAAEAAQPSSAAGMTSGMANSQGASPSASAVSEPDAGMGAAPVLSMPSDASQAAASVLPVSPNASAPVESVATPAPISPQMAALTSEIHDLRVQIAAEKKDIASIHSHAGAPRVIYRTIVREVPQHAPAKTRQGDNTLPLGYALAGGGGHSVLVRTPSGGYRTVRAGDALDGRIVRSVQDGHIVMGSGQ